MDEFLTNLPGELLSTEQSDEFLTAVVGAVNTDGVTLIFPGEDEAGEKNYKCNAAVKLSAGDRVKIVKDSGTYLVEYPIGAPNSSLPRELPTGGSTGQILRKTEGGAAWANESRELPTGGSTGQVLTKTSGGAAWQNAPTELPTGGSTGQVLTKMSTGTAWQTATATQLKSGSYSLSYTYAGQLVNTGGMTVCSSSGNLGFFGSTGARKTTLTTTATLTQLINALKSYGLV